MSLEKWLQFGTLTKHEAIIAEIQRLFGAVDRDLSDASLPGMSDDGRFMHAYDAAFRLCKIALHVTGCKDGKVEDDHADTLNSLEHTLGQKQTASYLSTCSTKRQLSLHEQVGVVSPRDSLELLKVARRLRTDILTWLRAHHAKLLPKGF